MRQSDPFDNDFFRNAEKRHDEFFRAHGPSRAAKAGIGLWFLICAAVSLAMTGVIIWGVIELVQWVTTK